MKLWLDDIREAPEGWVWARTYDEAIRYLTTLEVTHASLDHDLAFDPVAGEINKAAKSGYDLVCWMEEHGIWPTYECKVHSQNPYGRIEMEKVIAKEYGKRRR